MDNSNPCFVNIQEAKNNFSKLLARAHAGEEIIICKAGKPYAKLISIAQPEERELGFLSHLFTEEELEAIDQALREPIGEEELALWYGETSVKALRIADRESDSEDEQ
jgi:prevent-host-death family protein